MRFPSSRFVLAAAITALVMLPGTCLRAHAAACGQKGLPLCPVAAKVGPNLLSSSAAPTLPARSLPHFTFAPPTAAAGASVSTSASVPAAVVHDTGGTSSSTDIFHVTLLVLAVGAVAGGLAALYPAIRRRFEPSPRTLAYRALERRLEELWTAEEHRVG